MKKMMLIIGLLLTSLTVVADSSQIDFNVCKYLSKNDRARCLNKLSNAMLENSLRFIDADTGEELHEQVSVRIEDAKSGRVIQSGILPPGKNASLNGINGKIRVIAFADSYSMTEVEISLASSKNLYSFQIKKSFFGGRASRLSKLTSPDKGSVVISELVD